MNETEKKGTAARDRLYKSIQLKRKLEAKIKDVERVEWLLSHCADVFAHWEGYSEPPKEVQARLSRIIALSDNLADELSKDSWLDDTTVLLDAAIWDQPDLDFSGNLKLSTYLRRLSTVLSKEINVISGEYISQGGYSSNLRRTNFKSFAIRYVMGALRTLEKQGVVPRWLRDHNKFTAEIVSVIIEETVLPNDVTQVFKNSRRSYPFIVK